ncbi:MAG TPA: ribbon-helix-helix domain-containing protein [Azospirillaceae bacterium]|nr:ribbon-helix-helix domain-containing protein [Azospirillaceae bacterium]
MPPPSPRRPTPDGKSTLESRNVTVSYGRAAERTSVRLEPQMWDALEEVAAREGRTVSAVADEISRHLPDGMTLTSGIRVFLMAYFRAAAFPDGHPSVSDGSGRLDVAAAFVRKGRTTPPRPPA